MVKGLAALRGQADQLRTKNKGPLQMWFKPGQTAGFYFLTDADEAPVILLVGVPKTSGRGRAYTRDFLSMKETLEDETPCPLFDKAVSAEDNGYTGPWARLAFLVYVESIFHESKDEASWEAVRAGDTVLYKEPRNEIRLFVPKQRMVEQLEAHMLPDPTDPDDEGIDITKRAWRMVVSKDGQRNVETLKPGAKDVEIPEEANVALEEFGKTLNEVILDVFGPRGGDINTGGRGVREGVTTTDESPPATDLEDVDF